ncbi:MAG: D-alanyl-D-alanine carboxypeptidase [Proteobacteria bacterium]|nr:D-alanyl-D-alanine carboxypeptidase [SAR86 cluster bacterium]MDA0344690.1 D-alanyl-D-alanine carboxypeptidase [Pseudomonadota bacterium]MDA0899819.1 D-alanyl-D-alanine carboxypeptidase [Pseudomonadota bacterium]MDA1056419.1 D-alanyl-D-alanine carboxypeptidase [Pseudomonadota bacterium]
MLRNIFKILIFASPLIFAIPQPPDLGIGSYILYEPNTKKILVSYNEDMQVEPASLTKLMTSYVVADYINQGFVSLEDESRISIKAWKAPGSRMFIREGTRVKVSDLIKGMIVQSGNDASIALAEHIAGNEENFVLLMNDYAAELNMANTTFNNSTGLPDPLNLTTAKDLALLASAIIKNFPTHYKNYSQKSFTYGGITQPNRNRLLWRDESFDGMKTGYTSNAGWCLVGSATRGDMRLVAVVLGSEDDKRFNDVSALMNYGFNYFVTEKKVLKETSLKELKVVAGTSEFVNLGIKEDIILTLAKDEKDSLSYEIIASSEVLAPVIQGEVAGKLRVLNEAGDPIEEIDLVYLESIEQLGFFQRILAIIWNWIKSLFS